MILGFLYCGYGTVINLPAEGALENGGRGHGVSFRTLKLPSMRIGRGIADPIYQLAL